MTHKFAQYLILAASVLGFSALPALADSPCPVGQDLSYYLANFGGSTGCTVGNLDFSHFSFNNGGTDQIPAADIGVAAITNPDGPGLNFDPSADLQGANLSADVFVGFTVTALDGASIGDIYMGFGNVTTQDGGSALYTEQFCGGAEDLCSLFVEAPTTGQYNMVNLSSTALGGPVSTLTITKDLQLKTGSAADSIAATSSFLNEYSEVPEPRGVTMLLGLGLLAGFVIFKRRQVVQS